MKKATFWLTVAGVAILSNFVLELAAEKFPNVGLAKFTAYTHKGVN